MPITPEKLQEIERVAIEILSDKENSAITLYSPYSDAILLGDSIIIQKVSVDKFKVYLPRSMNVRRIKNFSELGYAKTKNENYKKRFEPNEG